MKGKDNFAADRHVAKAVLEAFPGVTRMAVESVKFTRRALAFLAERRVRQVLVLGSGLPAPIGQNLHDVVLHHVPDARVAYVDQDPVVLAHSSALLAGPQTMVVDGDLTRPDDVLGRERLADFLDLSAPVGLVLTGVFNLHSKSPGDVVAAYRDRLPPGSALVLSQITDDGAPLDVIAGITAAAKTVCFPIAFRSRKQITTLFDGWEVEEPGVEDIAVWRNKVACLHISRKTWPTAVRMLGGVGWKC